MAIALRAAAGAGRRKRTRTPSKGALSRSLEQHKFERPQDGERHRHGSRTRSTPASSVDEAASVQAARRLAEEINSGTRSTGSPRGILRRPSYVSSHRADSKSSMGSSSPCSQGTASESPRHNKSEKTVDSAPQSPFPGSVTWADDVEGHNLEEARRSQGICAPSEADSSAVASSLRRQSISSKSVAYSVFSFAVGDKPVWQWEHRTGFRCYEPKECERIEAAYMQGHDNVRVKTGKYGSTPMEIFFVDMIQHDPISGNSRKIRRIGREGLLQWFQRTRRRLTRFVLNGSIRRRNFKHYEQMRRDIYTNIDRKDYNVNEFYKEDGCCSYIASADWFFGLSMLAVLLSAVWTAVDADRSSGPDAPKSSSMETIVIDNCFCTFFTLELLVRFGAFQVKRNCLQDFWFVFDSILLVLMIAETWVLPVLLLFINQDGGNAPAVGLEALRAARLVRLTRLGRIARLVHVLPEVMTLLKGIAAATRSVLVTLLLLLTLLFLFGVVFRMQAGEHEQLSEIIPTVPEAMMMLLLHGTLLDAPAEKLDSIGQHSGLLVFLFLVYIFLSNFTVLNMLIGILCGVVSSVAEAEREQAAVQFLKSTLLELLECHDRNNDRAINNEEFELLLNNPEVHLILSSFGVDVADLHSLKDLLFHNKLLKSSWVDDESSSDEEELLTVDVLVTIVCANNLPAGDVHLIAADSSDPYVVVDRPGRVNEEFKTIVVNRSLDPVWNTTGTIREYSSNEVLRFSVYDSDWGKEDDLLAKISLGFEDIYPGGFDGTLELLGPNGQVSPNFGTLTVKVMPDSEPTKKRRGEAGEPVLTFAEFLEVVLRLRGDKSASVHDVVELRHSIFQGFNHLDKLVGAVLPPKASAQDRMMQVSSSSGSKPADDTRALEETMLACLDDLQAGQLALRAELEQMAGANSQKYEEMSKKIAYLDHHMRELNRSCTLEGFTSSQHGVEDAGTAR